MEQLRRAACEVEALRWYVGVSYGAYLVLRGRPGEALRWLEQALREEPLSVVGWAHTHGVLARAHNMLGDHLKARELCTSLLAQLSDEDLAFPSMYLLPQIELALAEAGLGRLTEAEQQLDALLERHRPQNGPLTFAALYEARAQVALLANNEADFERAIEGLREAWRRTNAPTLLERAERLVRRRTSSQRENEPGGSDAHGRPMLDTVLHMLRHGGTGTVRDRASWALAQLADFTGVDEAHVYLCSP